MPPELCRTNEDFAAAVLLQDFSGALLEAVLDRNDLGAVACDCCAVIWSGLVTGGFTLDLVTLEVCVVVLRQEVEETQEMLFPGKFAIVLLENGLEGGLVDTAGALDTNLLVVNDETLPFSLCFALSCCVGCCVLCIMGLN